MTRSRSLSAVVAVLAISVLFGGCAPDTGSWTTGAAGSVPASAPRATSDAADRVPAPRLTRAARAAAGRPAAPSVAPPVEAFPADREPPDPPPPPDDARAHVVGRVVDADGRPLDRAEVSCFLGVASEAGRTDDDGTFRIGIEEPTGGVRCLAWARGWAVSVGEWRALADGDTLDVGTIRLAPAARIEGRLVDGTGSEVAESAGVSVEASEAFDAETWDLLPAGVVAGQGLTSPQGARFRFDSLPPGRHVLRFSSSRRGTAAVEVTAPDTDVTLVVPCEARAAATPVIFETVVRVLDADGTPVARRDWTLAVRAPEDPEGPGTRPYGIRPWHDEVGEGLPVRIEVPSLPCLLVVHAGRRTPVVTSVDETPGDEVVIRLPPLATGTLSISGTVTSRGRPLTWERHESRSSCYGGLTGTPTEVSAWRADGTGPVRTCDTSGDGSFAFHGLDDAEYDLWVRESYPWAGPRLAPAETRVRADVVGVVLDLPVAGTRRFEVRGPGGTKLDEVEAWVEAVDDAAVDDATCEHEGAVVTASLLRPGATYRLGVRGRVGRTWTAWTCAEGWTAGEDSIRVDLDPGLTIRGRVVRTDGSPVPVAYVHAKCGDDETDTYAALDGTFTLTGLSPGDWRLVAYAPALSSGSVPALLPAGSPDARIVVLPE